MPESLAIAVLLASRVARGVICAGGIIGQRTLAINRLQRTPSKCGEEKRQPLGSQRDVRIYFRFALSLGCGYTIAVSKLETDAATCKDTQRPISMRPASDSDRRESEVRIQCLPPQQHF